jgi:hypothetical protein
MGIRGQKNIAATQDREVIGAGAVPIQERLVLERER